MHHRSLGSFLVLSLGAMLAATDAALADETGVIYNLPSGNTTDNDIGISAMLSIPIYGSETRSATSYAHGTIPAVVEATFDPVTLGATPTGIRFLYQNNPASVTFSNVSMHFS